VDLEFRRARLNLWGIVRELSKWEEVVGGYERIEGMRSALTVEMVLCWDVDVCGSIARIRKGLNWDLDWRSIK
jgi:hypothetical protein